MPSPHPPWRRALKALVSTPLLFTLGWPEDPYGCAPNDQVEMVQVPQWEEAPPAVVGGATLVIVMENQWQWTIRSAFGQSTGVDAYLTYRRWYLPFLYRNVHLKCENNCRVAFSLFSLISPRNSLDVTWLKSPPSPQPFSSGRQVVVERHSRDSGLRKEWQSGSNSQDRAFPDNRRMESRGSMMGSSRYNSFRHKSLFWTVLWCELQAVLSVCSHSSSGINRIVQITSNSIPSGGNTGGFKSYKGTRQF